MNDKLSIPDEIIPGENYSFRADLKVNGWLLFAMATGAANGLLFHSKSPYGVLRNSYQDWPIGLRAVVELVPLLASLLWAWSLARWLRRMDELHCRITLEAWFFATISTLFVLSIWPLLDGAGVSAAVLQATHVHLEALDKPIFPLTVGMLYIFYFLGHFIFNRRFK
jgi:hypothetical protein